MLFSVNKLVVVLASLAAAAGAAEPTCDPKDCSVEKSCPVCCKPEISSQFANCSACVNVECPASPSGRDFVKDKLAYLISAGVLIPFVGRGLMDHFKVLDKACMRLFGRTSQQMRE